MPIERELEFRQLQDCRIKEIADELEFHESSKFELVDVWCIERMTIGHSFTYRKV